MYRPADHPDQKGEPDWVKSEREMFKSYRDKNGDGKLDKDELKEWIMPSGFDHAEAEARHLIHLADDNKVRCLFTVVSIDFVVCLKLQSVNKYL